MLNQNRILSVSPWVEVVVRILYWRIPILHSFLAKFVSGRLEPVVAEGDSLDFDLVVDGLRAHGLRQGDILIVHSSGRSLRPFGLSADAVIEKLLNACGQTGTVAMPAIRTFTADGDSWRRMHSEDHLPDLEYDVRHTPVWTGVLPRTLMRRRDAVISRHPINSMVAVGSRAHEMMARNLEGNQPTGCGPQSSWKYCVDHDALIAFVGVDAAHNMTAIHVAEDAWESCWARAADWYRVRRCKVIDDGGEQVVFVRERRPRWAMYYAERTLQRDLIDNGLLRRFSVGPVEIQVIRAGDLIAHLRRQRWRAYPYKIPFWV